MSQLGMKTPVSLLQEFTMKNGFPIPKYEFLQDISKTGRHINEFYYKVTVNDVAAVGSATSKNTAKHNAASKALELLGAEKGLKESSPIQHLGGTCEDLNVENEKIQDPTKNSEHQILNSNFIGQLYELCSKLKLSSPAFFEYCDDSQGSCKFKCECKVDSITSEAVCFKKKEAKQLASKIMLENIKNSTKNMNKLEEDGHKQKEDDKMEIDESDNFCENKTVEAQINENEINVPQDSRSNPIRNVQDMQAIENMSKINKKLAGLEPKEPTSTTSDLKLNYIGRLNEICSKLKISSPHYVEYGSPISNLFECECTVDTLKSYGAESSKKNARHLAAKDMIERIKRAYPFIKFYNCDSSPQKKITNETEDKTLLGVIKRKMSEKNLSFDSFQKYFRNRNQENLNQIFNLLGITYKIEFSQESPPIAVAIFDFETPRNFLAIGTTKESAEKNLITQIYIFLDIYVGLPGRNSSTDDDSEDEGSGENDFL